MKICLNDNNELINQAVHLKVSYFLHFLANEVNFRVHPLLLNPFLFLKDCHAHVFSNVQACHSI